MPGIDAVQPAAYGSSELRGPDQADLENSAHTKTSSRKYLYIA